MTYAHDVGNGQQLLIENDGDNTQFVLSGGDSGQQQNQSTGFSTGNGRRPRSCFASPKSLFCVLKVKVARNYRGSRQSDRIDAERARIGECRKTHA